jgi:hypothetical protein
VIKAKHHIKRELAVSQIRGVVGWVEAAHQLITKHQPIKRKGSPRNSPSPGIRRVGMLPSNINTNPARTRSGFVKHQISFSMVSPIEENTEMLGNQ